MWGGLDFGCPRGSNIRSNGGWLSKSGVWIVHTIIVQCEWGGVIKTEYDSASTSTGTVPIHQQLLMCFTSSSRSVGFTLLYGSVSPSVIDWLIDWLCASDKTYRFSHDAWWDATPGTCWRQVRVYCRVPRVYCTRIGVGLVQWKDRLLATFSTEIYILNIRALFVNCWDSRNMQIYLQIWLCRWLQPMVSTD